MRTIDQILADALASESFNAYIQCKIDTTLFDVSSYKLTETELKYTIKGNITVGQTGQVQVVRGVVIEGTEYTLSSSLFFITKKTSSFFKGDYIETTVQASLFPEEYISFAADDTYENVITTFCTTFGKTAVFDQPSAALWGYKFYPTGKVFTSNNARTFLNVLSQKYFIFACDNGNEEVLFFQGMADRLEDWQYNVWYEKPNPLDLLENDIITNNIIKSTISAKLAKRSYLARDETGSVRTGGATGEPIHNLGYLESTDSFPDLSQQDTNEELETEKFLINLTPQSGDIVRFDPNYLAQVAWPIEVIEEYDSKSSPSWSTVIRGRTVFSNTAGGALPSTIERVAAYTPLVSTGFDGNLTPAVNNLQALAQAVDDLDLGGTYTDEQAQDAVGAMVAGNTETGIAITYDDTTNKINFDAQTAGDARYAPIAKGVTSGDSHNHVGGDGAAITIPLQFAAHGLGVGIAASTTDYTCPGMTSAGVTQLAALITVAGTLKNMYIRTGSAQPASGSLVYALQVNGSDSALVITIAAGGAAGNYTDLTHTVALNAGDRIGWKRVNNATGTSAVIGSMVVELDTPSI